MDRMKRRNILNNVMLTLTGVCTVITSSVLFLILGFLVFNGWRSLDWDFFTKLPLSAGEMGGGMANAIVGSAVLILIAAAIGIPVGFLGGIYLAEFGGKTVPMLIRYTADLLNGVPSIVIGIFAWTVIVVPMHHFSAWAGWLCLEPDDDPHRPARHRAVSAWRSQFAARRFARSGRQQNPHHHLGDRTRGQTRHPHGHDPGRRARRRRNRASAVYEFQQSILGQQSERAHRLAARR